MENQINKVFIYTDGASKGNPGPSGVGVAVYLDDFLIIEKGYQTGLLTNNQAEYLAIIVALEELKRYNQEIYETYFLHFHSDSLLLIKQLQGSYKVRNPQLKKIYDYIIETMKPLTWTATHIFREYNRMADKLANRGVLEKIELPDYLFYCYDFFK